jgi:hypothetical protein
MQVYSMPHRTVVRLSPTWDKANRVSMSFLGITLNIDATKDTVVIDGTSHAPNFYTGATLYNTLVALFPKATTTGGGGGSTIDASQLTTGTLPDARLSGNVVINLVPTAIKTSAYTAQPNDLVKVDATSGNVPITLPTAPADKTRIAVKMIAVSGSNTTAIATGGSDVFNKAGGSTSATLTLLNQAATFQYEAATGIWSVISGDIALSQLDLRYAPVSTNTRTALFLGAMTSTQRDAISSPTAGSMIFNTTTGFYEQFEDTYWQWMPYGGQQGAMAKYYFDYTRPFYTANNDHIFTVINVNSGTTTGGGAPTGSTAEAGATSTLSTASLATGHSGIATSATVIFGSGQTMAESRIYLPTLSNSTDRYIAFAGFSDNSAGVDVGNGMGIFYDEGGITSGSTASPNWQLVTAVNNVRTINQTSVAVAANTWVKLRTQVAADGSWVRYFINDVLVNPSGNDVTTNIPTGVTRISRVNTFIHKNAGTTARTMLLNTMRFRQKYTNAR